MQLRRLAALERQKIIDEAESLESEITDFRDILARPERQRTIISWPGATSPSTPLPAPRTARWSTRTAAGATWRRASCATSRRQIGRAHV